MLIHPPLETLLPKAENRYVLAMFASRRARQLTSGARPMVESDTPNYVSLACEEIGEGAVVYRNGKHAPVVPERPEIIARREAERREAEAKREEDLMDEQRNTAAQRRRAKLEEETSFEREGITAREASMLAQQLIRFVNEQDENASEPAATDETGADA